MGALPNLYPGYQQVANADVRAKFEKAWNAALSDKPGLTVTRGGGSFYRGAGNKQIRSNRCLIT
jgi:hypothetical protein